MKKLFILSLAVLLCLLSAPGFASDGSGMWVLVNTETKESGANEYTSLSGSNGSYHKSDSTDNQGSGSASASISEPPPAIKPGDEILFEISGSYSGNFPFFKTYSAGVEYPERFFTLDSSHTDNLKAYTGSVNISFGTGGGLSSSDSATAKLIANGLPKSGVAPDERAVISIGLGGGGGIKTYYTYEWRE